MLNAKLIYRYATMGSGKSTEVLQVHHNYSKRGVNGLLLIPEKDTSSNGNIYSRLGISHEATVLKKEDNIYEIVKAKVDNGEDVQYIILDEVNLIENLDHIEQLGDIVDFLNINVFAYGLLSDFKGKLFEPSKRIIELADKITSIGVKSICHCGKVAVHNARVVNGELVTDGEVIVIDNKDSSIKQTTEYVPLCRKHFKLKQWH